jgi:hypothetical protein
MRLAGEQMLCRTTGHGAAHQADIVAERSGVERHVVAGERDVALVTRSWASSMPCGVVEETRGDVRAELA